MSKITQVAVEYNKFAPKIKQFVEVSGDKGFVLYTENRAFVSFDNSPEIVYYLSKKTLFTRNDFVFLEPYKFEIIGKSTKESFGLLGQFIDDLKNNKIKILISTVIYYMFFNSWSFDIEILMNLNDKAIDVVSIFIGMVFVFVGFFYGDKERTIQVYKKGLCDSEFSTDRYIILLSFVSMVLFILSSILGRVSLAGVAVKFINDDIVDVLKLYGIKYLMCAIMTYMAILFLIICFDSLINYYLKTMRNKYLIDAVEEMIYERKNKK